MSNQPDELQSKVSQLFQAIVAEYDRLAPVLIKAHVPLDMLRGLQSDADKAELKDRDEMTLDRVSAHEGHVIGNGVAWGGLVLNGTFSNPVILQDTATKFVKDCGDKKIAIFNRVACYMSFKALKTAAEMQGIKVNVPNEADALQNLLKPPFWAP